MALALVSVISDAGGWDPPVGWWDREPMIAEIAGGVILLLVGVFFVDTIVKRRQSAELSRAVEARWDALGGIPFRSLGLAMTRVIDRMAWLLTLIPAHGAPPGWEPQQRRALDVELQKAGLRQAAAGADAGKLQHQDLAARLGKASAHPPWCRSAVAALDDIKWDMRDRVAMWAGPMLALERLAPLLGRLGMIDTGIGAIQTRLRQVGGFPDHQLDPDGKTQERLVAAWFATLAQAVVLREELHRASLTTGDVDQTTVEAEMRGRERFGCALRDTDRCTLCRRAEEAGTDPDGARKVLLTPFVAR